MKLIVDVSEEVYKQMISRDIYKSIHERLCYKTIQDGTPIPDNATNGDVIKAMFPNTHMEYIMWTENLYFYETDWWNAPYKRSWK